LGRYSLLISLTILLGEQRPRLRCVLELAAGTGIVTRRLRDLLPREARLVATDLKPPMLEVARGKFRPDETVEFQPADATALPFPNASFDSVVCQFGVMFFPDTSVAISAANIRYTEARPQFAIGERLIGNYRTMEAKAQAAVDAELAELAASITQREP
jgi:SAM-dependent methyltransferase